MANTCVHNLVVPAVSSNRGTSARDSNRNLWPSPKLARVPCRSDSAPNRYAGLSAEQGFHQALMDQLPDPIFVVSPVSGKTVYCNAATFRHLEVSPAGSFKAGATARKAALTGPSPVRRSQFPSPAPWPAFLRRRSPSQNALREGSLSALSGLHYS